MPEDKHKHSIDPSRWVGEHGDYLFSYAISRISKREIAEDMVQETLLAAFQARDKFRGGSSERTWLVSILKRKVIDYYRKESRNPESLSDNFSAPFYKGGAKDGTWIKEHAPSSWDEEIAGDADGALMEVLQYCISLLAPRMAATFSMKTLDEISTEEICKELGISESNLWVLLHRARLQLRECVENKWFKEL
ncbi:MAG: sigma-70 family RNA polymerase sigma factor [Bacteroidales bacterium]|nr:sigma-70 family RNA polymerase sigma factor [Bacteroidales bacterium]